MDAQWMAVLAATVVALLAGLAAGWAVARASLKAALEAAVTKAQAELQAELAQVKERVRNAEESWRAEEAGHAKAQADLERARQELDIARDEVAKYTERSAQLPGLQQRIQQLESELGVKAADLLRISQDAAQKAQLVQSQAGRLAEDAARLKDLEAKVEALNRELQGAVEAKAALEEQARRVPVLEQELRQTEERLDAARSRAEAEVSRLTNELGQLQVTLDAERVASQEKLALLDKAQEALSDRFNVLANQILEEKSQKFAEQNKFALGALLDPLSQQLKDFKGKVEEVYVQEGKDRTALAEQVKQLLTLNQTLSQDAQNLTQALKGNAQTQGAWGEWLLEQTLSTSGLIKDQQYFLQDSATREDGSRGRPDALINLPGERQLVVDAKMSLLAYEQFASAKSEDERALALKAHLDSMKKHIAGLSAREYQKLYPTLDFVLMFVPLEPAFMLAATHDKQLFTNAWDKNVLLVSPSTLLFVLRTVAYLWRQEAQNQNAQAIADRGARLYDKFVDFTKDLEQVGQRLAQAQGSYADAFRKLHDGNGNLVSQAQKLTSLGVKATKKLSTNLLQLSGSDIETAEELAARAARNTPHAGGAEPGLPAAAAESTGVPPAA
jgi:DNA recombination protein RmuC